MHGKTSVSPFSEMHMDSIYNLRALVKTFKPFHASQLICTQCDVSLLGLIMSMTIVTRVINSYWTTKYLP